MPRRRGLAHPGSTRREPTRGLPRRGLLLLLLPLLLVQPGCFYGNFRTPLDVNVSDTRIGDKVGRADCKAVMWMFAWGDCGVAAAADDGGIEVIQQLDTEYLVILFGMYFRRTTIAYGE